MLKQLKNKDGVVFVTVLAIIIAMMALAVTIISLNSSQTTTSEREVQQIKAEAFSMGALAYTFANQLSDSPGNTITLNETLDGIVYDASIVINNAGSGPTVNSDSKPLTINISY